MTKPAYVQALATMRALADGQDDATWQTSLSSAWVWALRGLARIWNDHPPPRSRAPRRGHDACLQRSSRPGASSVTTTSSMPSSFIPSLSCASFRTPTLTPIRKCSGVWQLRPRSAFAR